MRGKTGQVCFVDRVLRKVEVGGGGGATAGISLPVCL